MIPFALDPYLFLILVSQKYEVADLWTFNSQFEEHIKRCNSNFGFKLVGTENLYSC